MEDQHIYADNKLNSTAGSDYEAFQVQQQRIWEARCQSCGACCGVVDRDPCEKLVQVSQEKYTCSVYDSRLGLRKTRQGKIFHCVNIRDILHESWPGEGRCAYKKWQRSQAI